MSVFSLIADSLVIRICDREKVARKHQGNPRKTVTKVPGPLIQRVWKIKCSPFMEDKGMAG